MAAAVAAAYLPIRALPTRAQLPPATAVLVYRPVELASVAGPLRLAGAWTLHVSDPRFGGISALAIDRGQFLAVADRGSVTRFDPPAAPRGRAWIADLRDGPGPWGRKWSRDAESLLADLGGRGWWVGYEQNHSVMLYDRGFGRSLSSIDLDRLGWGNNRGAEGLLADGERLLIIAENGREVVRIGAAGLDRIPLAADADVADASTAPDGSNWLLLRSKGWQGISQWIAPLVRESAGFRAGPRIQLPKGAFDNYEGMAIERRQAGGLRFWLISDDGHRIMARTLLVALDYVPAATHGKGPAASAEPSQQPID